MSLPCPIERGITGNDGHRRAADTATASDRLCWSGAVEGRRLWDLNPRWCRYHDGFKVSFVQWRAPPRRHEPRLLHMRVGRRCTGWKLGGGSGMARWQPKRSQSASLRELGMSWPCIKQPNDAPGLVDAVPDTATRCDFVLPQGIRLPVKRGGLETALQTMLTGRLARRARISPKSLKGPPGIGPSSPAKLFPTPLRIRLAEPHVPLVTYRRRSNPLSPSPTHQANPPRGSADFDPSVIIQLPLSQRSTQPGISIDLGGAPPSGHSRLKRGEVL
ncbi:hypothetical protein SUDANB106_01642 [Streptomyces sp. enrichment culture]